MVFFNELFQTVRLSKWYLHFDTPSFILLSSYDNRILFHLNNSKVLIFKIQIKFLDFKFIFRKLL